MKGSILQFLFFLFFVAPLMCFQTPLCYIFPCLRTVIRKFNFFYPCLVIFVGLEPCPPPPPLPLYDPHRNGESCCIKWERIAPTSLILVQVYVR